MRAPHSAAAAAAAVALCLWQLPGAAVAHPGPNMDDLLVELKQADCWDSKELIGDLLWLSDYELQPEARLIKGILLGYASGQSYEYNTYVPPLHSPACSYDTCCVWQYIANDMERLFRDPSGRCTDAARGAIRLGFHDAAGWSKYTGQYGGADGSIVLAPEETERHHNRGLREIIEQMRHWHHKWGRYGVSVADLIQMAANVATVVCPLGPRVFSFVGRRDSYHAAPDGLVPNPFAQADELIELFRDKTIQPRGLAALLGAHSTSRQRHVDKARAGAPQDSTPGVWDTLYYKQTLGHAPHNVFRLPSDVILSEDPRIFPQFQAFAGPGGQEHWNDDYAREYVRLSLLGVYNINNLTDCSRVLPPAIRAWNYDGDVW